MAPIRTVLVWIGPLVKMRDASIVAGLLWYAALVGALWAGTWTFGLLMTATAMVGTAQAVSVLSRSPAEASPHSSTVGSPPIALDSRYRLPAAVLAGAVALAGNVDTRLAGAVLAAAAVSSFVVVGTLQAERTGRTPRTARSSPRARQPGTFARVSLLIRTWIHVGVAAACSAAVARYSLGAALTLVTAAAAYDAGAHIAAAGKPPGARGPLVGVLAAGAMIFALSGLSVPPFAPSDVVRFGVLAALTLPLGPATARQITALALHPRPQRASIPAQVDPPHAERAAARRLGGLAAVRQRLVGEWAVRRIDSLAITGLAWMWGLGLLTF